MTWRGNSGLWASFSLDKRAQAIDVSRDWVAVAQDRDVWRRVVAEGSFSCLDNEGWTPLGVAPPCMSVNVSSSGHELSVTEVATADANPALQSKLTGCC